ncbi:tRNA 2-selenouridine(34) synthase MnmH [Thiomicrorhabdus sp. ZW0627]|uniref:tRNA 2-selenouridine(34) synthase MnmH n=1 Tax=Thiomicrorhabdus sp. ZW0627 TaxID=3039774 RepID=UPI0024370E87|nr:tRNA 2-selenouridine(34) synthase MnmH [Thiomicrorhabdus sp. ZW0627]MDG6773916.1 tRNA 2-selenouridine(34) synthase MnmH [Thiomicrorhabdus sp. ZW0627]
MAVKLTEFSESLPQTDDFRSIVLKQTPLIDVRAPVEFNQGAFASATNLPLMNDEERQKVGLCYKQHGNAAAVKLGHQLVSESVREPRIEAWSEFMDQHPDSLLYCFRGGMRSKISQQWLADSGRDIVRLKGGYKAFRRYLIDYMDEFPALMQQRNIQPLVLAGRTGSGKTLVIQRLEQAVDLEGLAHHRGSAFGRHATPQPTQINFENQLAMALIRFMENAEHQLVIEDEARNIGSVSMPKPLFDALKSGNRIIVDTPLEERVQITHQEYVVEAQQEYPLLEDWVEFMQAAFDRIRKRLGGERHQRVLEQFQYAMERQMASGETENHQLWIKTLLSEYYDPMYDYQIQKNSQPICFTGTMDEVVEFLQTN